MVDAKPDERFRDRLAHEGPVLFDGAMGTMLYSKGVFIQRAFEELNLTQPGLVRDVHEQYVAAGAQVIETNTFAANRFRLSPYGLETKVEELNRRGVELAREAAAGRAWVAGAVGPLGTRMEPYGPLSAEEVRGVFAEQVRGLVLGGVDLLVLETFSHLPELAEAIRAARDATDLPIIAQVVVAGGAVTREGVAAAEVAERLAAAGADAIGVNCCDPLAALEALAAMRRATPLPLIGQPNAGQPRSIGGRNLYLASPEYLLAWGRRAARSGVKLLGGCCGTTPDHIRALQQALGQAAPEIRHTVVSRPRQRPPIAPPVERAKKSILAAALAAGRRVYGVQVPPSRGWDTTSLLEAARRLALAGVTYISLREGAPHGAHAPPLALVTACRRAGIEPVIPYSCRGRRLARMQSDLLGAAATGAANLLLVTGDPLEVGALPEGAPDLEVDAIGLVNLVTRLNHGEDLATNPIGAPTGFHIGAHLDPSAPDLERELNRAYWKIDAGAEFMVTSPIFDPQALGAFLGRLRGEAGECPVIANLWPLRSAREAELFEREMASLLVPAHLVARMQAAEAAGREREEGLAIARELARAVLPLAQGLQVVAPDGDLELALAVVDAVR
jgi:homocysteine S-methyltransferase